ncbi:Alpha-amylase [Mycena chlorophos]|uniref:alpha-amylase n=1 Tax=Mycena chlorophos TaxID=658473 RepID=A0A8H6W237_MYCCL|nr:Alpha-amylase [Mycena chlorophos]
MHVPSALKLTIVSSVIAALTCGVVGTRDFKKLRRAPAKANNTIVQLFEWPWDSVASECTSFIGPFGYGFVQVSPPQEHITGPEWWTVRNYTRKPIPSNVVIIAWLQDYQPVSYNLTSKRGTREQFANMVSTCQSAGVGVIADGAYVRRVAIVVVRAELTAGAFLVVMNHLTGGPNGSSVGTGFAGSSFSKYSYPLYNEENFHYCDGTVAATITDFNNLTQVRTCELVGLSDLDQSQPAVQATLVAYMSDLLSLARFFLGVSGFRVDAARHMDPNDLKTMFSQLNGAPYITQEVTSGGASTPDEYTGNGDIIEFDATAFIQAAFTGSSGSVSNLVTPVPLNTPWDIVNSTSANVIMANQDTERSGASLTSESPNNAYILSAIFLLGFNYGTPTIFSGYNFSGDFNLGAPQNASGFTEAITCFQNGFRCEHRFIAIANMNLFHNAVEGQDLRDVAVGTTQQVAFGRGTNGFLVLNNDATTWTQTFNTSLPAGDYCDIIYDTDTSPTTCSGPTVTVSSDGTFSASINAFDALALYNSA